MKYVIFSDVDGTIYDRSKEVLLETKKAIKHAIGLGVEFVIATGNGPFENMKMLANQLGARYLISSNGAIILDLRTGRELFKSLIGKRTLQKVVDLGLKHNTAAAWWDDKEIFVSNNNEKLGEIVSHYMSSHAHINYTNSVKRDALKIEYYGEKTNIDEIAKELQGWESKLQIARMSDYHIELTMPNVSKGAAIINFARYYNLDLENCMAIGDSSNDYTMLNIVPNSFAMGNSDEHIKKVARHQTETVMAHGVAKAIYQFLKMKGIERKA